MQMQAGMTTFLTLVGMMLVTAIPRILPLVLISASSIPGWVRTWLQYIPVAVLAALLFPSLLMANGEFHLAADNLFLWAAIPSFWIARRTRSMLAAVAVGLLVVSVGRLLGY